MRKILADILVFLLLAVALPIFASYFLKKYNNYRKKRKYAQEEEYYSENNTPNYQEHETTDIETYNFEGRPDFNYTSSFLEIPLQIENKEFIMDFEKFKTIYNHPSL